ncbi:MAG: hypothetical protein P8013_00820 [Candidatus Sulfobium sp.]|jgi:hypothetical protein
MSFWDDVRKDLEKSWKEGLAAVKVGAAAVKVKAEELTEEGKKRYRIYELKTKVEKEISDLGGRVYDISGSRRNPLLDDKVKAAIGRIRKLENSVKKLEGKVVRKPARPGKKPGGRAVQKPARPGKTVRGRSKKVES